MSADLLVHVEDPGAANLVVGLSPALAARGRRARLFAHPRLASYLAERETPFEPWPEGADAAAVLARVAPRAVAVGTAEDPDTAGLALVDAARGQGLPSVGMIDGPANAAFRFRGRGDGPLAHAPDWLAVPDAATADQFAKVGFPPRRVVVSGHPLHDRVWAARRDLEREGRRAARARTFPGVAADTPIVLFLAELSDGLDPAQFRRGPGYTLTGRGGDDRRTSIVLEEVLDALAPARAGLHVAVRPHPKNTPAEFDSFRTEIDSLSAAGSPWEAAFAADLVIGLSTSLLFEAALLGRPTLSVLPRDAERAWLPAIGAGVVRCATTRADLRAWLPAALADPGRLAGVPAERTVTLGAGDRLAALLCSVMDGRDD